MTMWLSPVHVNEEQVIPTDQIQSNPPGTKRNQHHLKQKPEQLYI